MLDIAPSELLLVAVVALVVIGPKDLPKALRVLGYWVGRARGVARQFRAGFDEMVREAELAEMEKKWASENERIMREHGGGDAASSVETSTPETAAEAPSPARADDDEARPVVATEGRTDDAEQVAAHETAGPAEPEQLTLLPEPGPRPERLIEAAASQARMRSSRPGAPGVGVPVEHPEVVAAPAEAAPPPQDPAAS